ncbi:MAG: hypothetical protein RI897_303 [Verrucomicrobiota bacterium]|jgi:hypothetical protein
MLPPWQYPHLARPHQIQTGIRPSPTPPQYKIRTQPLNKSGELTFRKSVCPEPAAMSRTVAPQSLVASTLTPLSRNSCSKPALPGEAA